MGRHAILVAVIGGLASPVLAQTSAVPTAVPPASIVSAPSEAVATLIRQAQGWLERSRPELATLSIQRALSADPRSADALMVAAQIEAARNNPAAARGYVTRLEQAGGTPDQRATAEASLRGATLDRAAIDQARTLAREGRSEEAASRYRAVFGAAGPTPPYAMEYYQTLAGSAAGHEEGVNGLARLATQPGASDRIRLANAQTMTFQPATRMEGMRQLATLADQPETADEARRAWRQALLFSGKDPAALPLLQAYLAKFPDADLNRQLDAINAARLVTTPSDTQRQQGFAELTAGALRESGTQFEAALAANPKDADALGGLGIVRLRENKLAEARTLLSRAVAMDPTGASKWQKALDGASYGAELGEARALLLRGDIEAADSMARAAARRQVPDQSDAEQLLGEIALRRRDPAAAEQHFRAVLAHKPGFASATAGLNQALRGQSRPPEGPEPATRAPRTASAPETGINSSTVVEATGLRAEAARATDPNVAAALLRNAVVQAPNDPWTRLDLARVLRRQGRASDGRALVEEMAARAGTPDANFAAALFAEEDGRPVDADALLARIPPARRTADMGRLQTRNRSSAEVARAVAMLPNGGGEGRIQLITLAARPDPSGQTAAAAIRALGDVGDTAGAGEAARAAEAANRTAGPTARIAIAGALLSAGLERDATVLADQLEGGLLAPEQRRDIASLRAGIAIRASDRLNEAGKQAEAFERLRPVITRSPENADGQLALARLYQNGRKPEEALRIADALLARDPRNLDARRGAVEAAISLGDRHRAEALAVEAEALTPNDSRVMLLQARIARGFGDETRARTLLAQATAQRRAELGVSGTTTGSSGAGSGDFANPFASTSNAVVVAAADTPQDPTSRDIAREAAAVRQEIRPTAAAELALRSRTGSGGLDKLNEYSATAEATITPPGISGRLTARLTATTIDEGKLVGNTTVLNKFGTNAAFGTTAVPNQTSATGAGIGIAYNRNDIVKVDIGTTPIGFPKTTIVGSVEVAPRIGDNLRLRLTAERRSVTDSLLSYAGTRDSITGTRWGMVEHTGGHGQIEASLGAGNVYAGGGYQLFDGTHVVSNRRVDAGTGYNVPIFKETNAELTSGIDLIYFGYSKAVEGFTLGQGGYFSPQYFFAANVPLDYRGKSGDFAYHLGAVVGYAKWKENASPLFPLDTILQAQADAAARSNPLIFARNQPQGRSGFTGGLRVDGEYGITPNLKLLGGVAYDKAANWNETRVTVRLQNQF